MSDKVKLIIEIPKYYLEHPQDYTCLAECVRRGIPIPDNATNGDVVKAFYPDLVVGSNNLGKTIFLRPNATVVIEDRMSDWWNAPYQKGGKE